ncbi:MAG: proton-conducting transporter membrane subunit [Campylobacterales bacterium]|nr:proton-conducting transporter membrane subunit [Campylobacterales bacterium]
MSHVSLLITLPLIFAVFIVFSGKSLRNILSFFFVGALAFLSADTIHTITSFELSHTFHIAFIILDTILLLFFLQQGFKEKDKLVWGLAFVQILLYGAVLSIAPKEIQPDVLVDGSFNFMYLIINIVGGIIILYALSYIESEEFSRLKKNSFIGILFFFLGVMNFIVSTNNIEIFFLLFELTTLCSYLLIRFRGDEVAVKNSLRALWMNQVGGVAILIALIFSITNYETIYFNTLLENANGYMFLPIVFLVIAGYVKGASIPFNPWLLGAMVAPTPVSAILHSATMVKIAPFLILKISGAFSPFLSTTIAIFGAFVFMTASILALSKDYFKEILGLSTIAILALIMALAAIGSEEARNAAILLIVFHAIAKALLFLQAGILEKVFHLKYVGDIESLANRSSFVLWTILFGFAVLTLPPFGAFVGKFMAFEVISSQILDNPFYGLVLIFIAIGSVVLTLLYFKVVTKLFNKSADTDKVDLTPIPFIYKYTSLSLVSIAVIGILVSFNYMTLFQVLIPIGILGLTIVMFYLTKIKDADRVKEYHCGEKDELELATYSFEVSNKYQKIITYTSLALIGLTILGGVL